MKSSKAEIVEFLQQFFSPSLQRCEIEEVTEKGASLVWHVSDQDIRPGGTVSGPTMNGPSRFCTVCCDYG